MNIPIFTAEASLYESGIHYRTGVVGIRSRSAVVESALIRQGSGLTCGGSCPSGQLLCQCDNDCKCCLSGCRCVNGYTFCDKTPAVLGGSTGFPVFSSGSVLML